MGFHLGLDMYKPTDERLAAIRDFQIPAQASITDVRSWFGFVNQLAPFLATAPLKALLKKACREKFVLGRPPTSQVLAGQGGNMPARQARTSLLR